MTTNRTKLERMERRAARSARTTDTARPALLAGVMAKAEQVLRGDVLELASWTNAPAAPREHRDGLLAWVETRRS